MAKGTLEYNLTDPDERREFDRATRAADMLSALQAISDEVFRPARKHGYPPSSGIPYLDDLTDREIEIIGRLERMFYDILDDKGINLYD